MNAFSDINNFQIIIQSGDEDNLSKDWQDQCKQFYYNLFMVLPEDSIKPLTLENVEGGKAFDTILYSNIIITDIAEQVATGLFIKLIIDAYNSWSRYRQNDYIIMKYPDGSHIKISKQLLSKLQRCSEENPQLSIFEVLNQFNHSYK